MYLQVKHNIVYRYFCIQLEVSALREDSNLLGRNFLNSHITRNRYHYIVELKNPSSKSGKLQR